MFHILFAAPAEKLATDNAMSGFFAKAVAYLMSQKGLELLSWLEVGPLPSGRTWVWLAPKLGRTLWVWVWGD